jgi:cyclic pyranopterin phosphate synthase
MSEFTHFDHKGDARMVDVSSKNETERVAVAGGRITMEKATLDKIMGGTMSKGDVLSVARLAGIMGAKRTPDLIPLCHPLNLSSVAVELTCDPDTSSVEITATTKIAGRTGVEMEALTAVQIGLLTVYDMCKAADRGMVIDNVRVLEKSGGKSGNWRAPDAAGATP